MAGALRRLCVIANAGLCAGRLAIPDHSVYTLCRRFKIDDSGLVASLMKQLEEQKEQAAKQLQEVKEQAAKQLQEQADEIKRLKQAASPLKQGSYVDHVDETHVKSELSIALRCFKDEYLGDGADRLKTVLEKRLKDFESGRKYYAKYVALSNSSGMGKSRTVLQLGHEGVFVFYCSIAKAMATTLPPRTPWLAPNLQQTVSTAGMTFYMIAWVNVLLKFLGKEPGADPAKRWLKEIFSPESSGVAEATAEQVFDEWKDLDRKFGKDYTGNIENMVSEETRLQEMLDGRINLVLKQLRELRGDTDEKDDGKDEMTVLKLLFVVDEAKGLLDVTNTSSVHGGIRQIPFLHLRRAARKLGPSTLLLVMDTSSRVGMLAPAGEDDESRRAREADRHLLQPVYCVNRLDLRASLFRFAETKDPTPGQGAKAWLEDADRWTRYGRSMWGQRFAEEKNILSVLELAQTKLLNISKVGREETSGEKPTKLLCLDPHKLTPKQSLCLLVFTVGIDILPWHHFAQELCSSHMTAMALISKDRRRFWTVAPLEPVLSAAAGEFFQDVDVLQKALVHFRDSLQDGFTSMTKGDRAEMVCKIFVMMAMWDCQASALQKDGKYLSCVPTAEFLKYLLGDCKLPTVVEGEGEEKVERDVLKGSFVFFNRIVCMDHVPTRKEALEFMKRGVVCAGNAANSNRGADIQIFVWFPSGKPVAGAIPVEEEITRLLISVKSSENQSAEKLTARFVGIRVQNTLPYVGIAYRADNCDSDAEGKLMAPVEDGQYVYKLKGRPRRLSEGRWKGCMKVLQDIIEVDPVSSAAPDDQEDYLRADPWTRKLLLPDDLRKEVKEDADLFAQKQDKQKMGEMRDQILKQNLRL